MEESRKPLASKAHFLVIFFVNSRIQCVIANFLRTRKGLGIINDCLEDNKFHTTENTNVLFGQFLTNKSSSIYTYPGVEKRDVAEKSVGGVQWTIRNQEEDGLLFFPPCNSRNEERRSQTKRSGSKQSAVFQELLVLSRQVTALLASVTLELSILSATDPINPRTAVGSSWQFRICVCCPV